MCVGDRLLVGLICLSIAGLRTWTGTTYDVSNGARKDIHYLRLSICCLAAIEKYSGALVDDYEREVVNGSDLICSIIFQA